MSEVSKPNVANDLARIHKIVSRGLDVASEHAQAYAKDGYPEPSIKEGYVSYARAFVSVTHSHHITEDDLAFPYFRDKLSGTPWEELEAEHKAMESTLGEIGAAIDKVATEVVPGPGLDDLVGALDAFNSLWHPHIQKEEASFDPGKVGAMLDMDEQIRLAQQFGKHSSEHSGPDFHTVPFLIYNLEQGADRTAMSRALPPVVTQELVPGPWKEKWAPMKPFLHE